MSFQFKDPTVQDPSGTGPNIFLSLPGTGLIMVPMRYTAIVLQLFKNEASLGTPERVHWLRLMLRGP